MTITRRTIAAALREAREYERDTEARHAVYYARYGNSMDAPRTVAQVNLAARNRAYNEVLPASSSLGGYPMAYYPMGDRDLTGDVLCADCARRELQDDKAARLIPQCEDSYEGDDSYDHLTCDQCYTVIAEAWDREEDTETAI